MKIVISFIGDTWARVKFYGINDHYLGVLAPSRGDSLPEIIRAAELAGWTVQIIQPEEENKQVAK